MKSLGLEGRVGTNVVGGLLLLFDSMSSRWYYWQSEKSVSSVSRNALGLVLHESFIFTGEMPNVCSYQFGDLFLAVGYI